MEVLKSVFTDVEENKGETVRIKSKPVIFEFRETPTNDRSSSICDSYLCGMEACRRNLKLRLLDKLEELTGDDSHLENCVISTCKEILLEIKKTAVIQCGGFKKPIYHSSTSTISSEFSFCDIKKPTEKPGPTLFHLAATLGLKRYFRQTLGRLFPEKNMTGYFFLFRLCENLFELSEVIGNDGRHDFCRTKSASSLTASTFSSVVRDPVVQKLRRETNIMALDDNGFTPLVSVLLEIPAFFTTTANEINNPFCN